MSRNSETLTTLNTYQSVVTHKFDFQLFFLMYSLNEFVIISTMCVDVEMSKNHHEVFCIELYNFDNNGMGKALYMYIGKTFVKVKVKVSV